MSKKKQPQFYFLPVILINSYFFCLAFGQPVHLQIAIFQILWLTKRESRMFCNGLHLFFSSREDAFQIAKNYVFCSQLLFVQLEIFICKIKNVLIWSRPLVSPTGCQS
ncbi:hypothetical protein C7379_11037 [Hallella colorans]|uniref:Uncharacterized protein n=1 Tax=Hallella colorans TaxID=1703337 RepID=A0A2U0U7I4_9BACT|nr:hypothetical protein C7379_11037 [Hallella colorans]